MSRIIVPLHLANLAQIPSGADTGFKKLYLRANWMKLHDGISETDLVLDRPLDNFTPIVGTITALDTVLTALEKLQYAISSATLPNLTLDDVTTNGNTTGNAVSVGGLTVGNLVADGYNFGISDNFDTNYNLLYTPYVGLTLDDFAGNQSILSAYGLQLNSGMLSYSGPAVAWSLPGSSGTIALTSDIPSLTGYATESWVGSNYYPLSTNPAGYLTSSSLSGYLTTSAAALTYFPIPTGTLSQYITGNGTLATFPSASIPTLQEVLDNNHDLLNGKNFQGSNAGSGTFSGSNVNAFGQYSCFDSVGADINSFGNHALRYNAGSQINAFGSYTGQSNSGVHINLMGSSAGLSNSGLHVNGFGASSVSGNSGSNVNAFGYASGYLNTYDNVNLLGENASADENGQTVLSKSSTIFVRLSTSLLTGTQKYNFPNQSGTIALVSDIPTGGGLPAGGTAGQILTKIDATDYNATWQENYADWTSVVKHTVKNDGTSLITKGTPVYSTGADGTNILVGKASNTSEATSSKTMGLMQSDITTTGGTQTGFVITEGLLGGLNTAGTTAGDPVWLGPTGTLIYGLINKPYAPSHLVFIGIVTKVSAGSGEIFVKVQNGFELKEIHDVDLITTTPSNNDVLSYDSTTSLWKNKSIESILGYTPFKWITTNTTPTSGSVVGLFETIIGTATIQGGTFNSSDVMKVFMQTSKLLSSAGVSYRFKINTTNTLSGAVQVGSFTTTNTLSYAPINRTFTLAGGNLIGNFGNAANDLANTAGSISSTPYNTANTLYVFFTIQLGNIGDTATIHSMTITN